MRNPFYLSDNEFERKFNNLFMDNLKTTSISNIMQNMHGTFNGSIEKI